MVTRRSLLRASAVALGASLTGCSSILPDTSSANSTETTTDDTTPPETTTDDRDDTPSGSLDRLSFHAEVTSQSSPSTPATVDARLENAGEETVRIGTGGPTITPIHVDGRLEDVVLIPETFVGPNETPETPSGSCWRYTDEDFLVQASIAHHDLRSNEALTETYSLYTVGADGPCQPAGEYRFEDELIDDDAEPQVVLGLSVAIDDGTVGVSADETIV